MFISIHSILLLIGLSNCSMYYPYRTFSDFGDSSTATPFGVGTQQGISTNIANGAELQRDQPAAPCTSVDPYWCQDYVRQSIDYQTKFGQMSQAQVCQQLRTSLIEAVNGCCQTLRSNGCQ